MKNMCLPFLSSVLAALVAFSPIQQVMAFGNELHSKPSTIILCRIPLAQDRIEDFPFKRKMQRALSFVVVEQESDGRNDEDTTNMSRRHETPVLSKNRNVLNNHAIIRLSFAAVFAFSLLASSFSSVEMATAAESFIVPTIPSRTSIIQTTTPTAVVADSSSTKSTMEDSLLSSSSLPKQEESVNNSVAGNVVLGAWIGISGFAGIKGAGDLYKRYQQEQQDEQE